MTIGKDEGRSEREVLPIDDTISDLEVPETDDVRGGTESSGTSNLMKKWSDTSNGITANLK